MDFYSPVGAIIRVNGMAPKSKVTTLSQLVISVEKLDKQTTKLNTRLDRHNALMNSVLRVLNEVAKNLTEVELES